MTPAQRESEHRLTLDLGALFALAGFGAYGLAQWVISLGWQVVEVVP